MLLTGRLFACCLDNKPLFYKKLASRTHTILCPHQPFWSYVLVIKCRLSESHFRRCSLPCVDGLAGNSYMLMCVFTYCTMPAYQDIVFEKGAKFLTGFLPGTLPAKRLNKTTLGTKPAGEYSYQREDDWKSPADEVSQSNSYSMAWSHNKTPQKWSWKVVTRT